MEKFRIEKVDDDEAWDEFVNASPEGTLFSLSAYLEQAASNPARFWVYKGAQVKAAICLVLSEDGSCIRNDDLVIHNGILFADDRQAKAQGARGEKFSITEYVIQWLSGNFSTIELALSPFFEDMRPFLWHRYHSAESREKFTLDLRYTSYLDISTLKNSVEEEASVLFRSMGTLRKRNLREARRANSTTRVIRDVSLFLVWYEQLMAEQEQHASASKLDRMESLLNTMLDNESGLMFCSYNADDEPLYAVIFGWDCKRAYYLFGAPCPQAKERYKGTLAFFDAFKYLAAQKQINEVDLEGVNSPNRGAFKLSFGGDLRSYYEVNLGG